MVKKKDGAWQFCIDYRKLNEVTYCDAYPLPQKDATLDFLAGATLFTTLDLASGYWQVEVDPSDKEKTVFSTSQGHFEFNIMLFSLTNAPADVLSQDMQALLNPYTSYKERIQRVFIGVQLVIPHSILLNPSSPLHQL